MPPCTLSTDEEVSSDCPPRPITSGGFHRLVTGMLHGAGFFGYFFKRVLSRRPARRNTHVAREPLPTSVPPAAPDAMPLPNSRLRALAAKRRPPQSWYEETVNPFEPAER